MLVIVDTPSSSVTNKLLISAKRGNVSKNSDVESEEEDDDGDDWSSDDTGEDEDEPEKGNTLVSLSLKCSEVSPIVSSIYVLDSLPGGHSNNLEISVIGFLNKKAIATSQLVF